MSGEQLERAGEQSLRNRLVSQAAKAHQKHHAPSGINLPALLSDPECLRHPVRLAYELGEMAPHQFGQPGIDPQSRELDGRVLYLRPVLQEHPDLLLRAVAYLIPLINYGEVVTDEHCLLYGATLLGLTEDEYYRRVCELADFVGATPTVADRES